MNDIPSDCILDKLRGKTSLSREEQKRINEIRHSLTGSIPESKRKEIMASSVINYTYNLVTMSLVSFKDLQEEMDYNFQEVIDNLDMIRNQLFRVSMEVEGDLDGHI